MKHLLEASRQLFLNSTQRDDKGENPYFGVADNSLTFQFQDGPIKEFGENGMQATDLLFFCKELFKSLNKASPCRENSLTITKIEEALHWQDARTKDRENRKVEGFSKE